MIAAGWDGSRDQNRRSAPGQRCALVDGGSLSSGMCLDPAEAREGPEEAYSRWPLSDRLEPLAFDARGFPGPILLTRVRRVRRAPVQPLRYAVSYTRSPLCPATAGRRRRVQRLTVTLPTRILFNKGPHVVLPAEWSKERTMSDTYSCPECGGDRDALLTSMIPSSPAPMAQPRFGKPCGCTQNSRTSGSFGEMLTRYSDAASRKDG
jgi:hypothetical protein